MKLETILVKDKDTKQTMLINECDFDKSLHTLINVEETAEGSEDITPMSKEERQEHIKSAWGLLDKEDDNHWTAAGLPSVDALSAISGLNFTRKEITEVFGDSGKRDSK